MRINTVSMDRREAILTVDADELVLLCNALCKVSAEFQNRKLYHKVRADLMLARDMSQYGHIDDFCLGKIMECRSHLQKTEGESTK